MRKRPFALYLLFSCHLFLGISAVAGGAMLIHKPDGSLLGMDPAWLDNSPFKTYIIPGFTLFILVGLLPMFTFMGLVLKPNWPWANAINIYDQSHWAWTYSLYSGIIAISWIAIQQIMTQFFWIQPVIIITGLFIIVFTLTPSVIKRYNKRKYA